MNGMTRRFLGLTVLIVLLNVSAQAVGANAAPRGRVGILNIMASESVHFHSGVTGFGDTETRHSLPSGALPEYINDELKRKLTELGYAVVMVETSLPLGKYPGYLVAKGWSDFKLTKSGKAIVKDLVERERLDFVLFVEDFARSDGLHPQSEPVFGHGLYTKAYIGDTKVPTSKIFGGFIGAVVRGSSGQLLGTSAPPYMETTEVDAMDQNGLFRVEATLRFFADQVVSGLVMYLDGTFQ